MQKLVNVVVGRLEFDIQKTGAEIVVAEDILPTLGYANWIEEAWLNYLSNAIKYGGKPPVIHISATLDPQKPGFVRYNVKDNGTGLTPQERAKLFKDFSRLGKHSDTEGHGLGLVIVKQMIERIGGTVFVESAVGEGSTFSFSLPIG